MDILRSSLKMKAPLYGSIFMRLFYSNFPNNWPTDCIVTFHGMRDIVTSAAGPVSKWCFSITNFQAFAKFLKIQASKKASAGGVCLNYLYNAGFVLRDTCEYFWERTPSKMTALLNNPSTTLDFYHENMLPTWWDEVKSMRTFAESGCTIPNSLYSKFRKSLRGFFVDNVYKTSATAVFKAIAPQEPERGSVHKQVDAICKALEKEYIRTEQPQQERFLGKLIQYKSRD